MAIATPALDRTAATVREYMAAQPLFAQAAQIGADVLTKRLMQDCPDADSTALGAALMHASIMVASLVAAGSTDPNLLINVLAQAGADLYTGGAS